MSAIPDPLTDSHDFLESALEVIRAHRMTHGYAIVPKRSKPFLDKSGPRIVYLEYDRYGAHTSTSTGKRTVSSKACGCKYSIVLRLKDGD